MEKNLKVVIPFLPEILLLNCSKPYILSKYTELALYLLVAARILYAYYWKRYLTQIFPYLGIILAYNFRYGIVLHLKCMF